jgi:CHAT domain-containing protein
MHFAAGRALYFSKPRKLQEAEAALKDATAEFIAGGSPGELLASAFTANVVYEAHRVDECKERLKEVRVRIGSRYPALRAGVFWEMGGVALAHSQWGQSLDAFRESLAIYEHLGEKNYAAVLEGLIGDVYGRIGEPAQSWKHRAAALHELGQTSSFRLHLQLDGIVQAAISERDWPVAESILGLDIELADRMKDGGVVAVESRLSRAELFIHRNDRMRAEADLAEAKRLIARREPGDRLLSGAKAKVVEAMLARDAGTAVALLTEAIAFHQNLGRRMYLPRLFMLRGRAHRSLANDPLARDDFESGIAELEKNRESLTGRDRWGIFHAAEDLFNDAIGLALDEDDFERAFAYAERERARGLLDDLGTTWRPVAPSDIPAGTVVIEYAVQDDSLVIFTNDRQRVHAVRQDVSREQVQRGIAALKHAAASSDVATIRRSGKDLYRILIAPVEERLIGASQIAFVPDPRLGNLPFAALCDERDRFLIESYGIAVEPSAAVFTRLGKHEIAPRDRRVLVATGSDELGVLTFAGEETRAIARKYGNVTQLSREQLTRLAFEREAAAANVIHFVGHGVVSQKPGEPAYILLGDGRLDAKEVASLALPRTSIVVLAACSTADGEIQSAEGTISMARAFVAAGASAVVGTLRPIVDRDAARFFPRFHQHFASGVPPAEALRRTQLEWIERGDNASIWTAVQMIGR